MKINTGIAPLRSLLDCAANPMFALRLLFVLVVAFATVPAAAEPPSVDAAPPWRTFSPERGRFEVELPGEPTEETAKEITPVGPIRGRSWWVDRGPLAFGVELRELPRIALALLSPNRIFDQAKARMLENDGGREIAYMPMDMDGAPGREVVYQTGDGRGHARLLLVGRRLYIVKAATPDDRADGAVERFFRSFKVWK